MNVRTLFNAGTRILTLFLLVGICGLALSGCSFLALNKNVAIYKQQVRLSGHLWNLSPRNKPVIVLLYQVVNQKKRIVNYRVYHTPDRFQFMVMPGEYLIEAFEDANQDLRYQDTEWATSYGTPSTITIEADQNKLNLNITLQPPGDLVLTEYPNLSSPVTQARLELPQIRFGEIVSLEDDRFSEENGRLSLWEPLRFLQEVGGGLYFLEPFDPGKIPVLFIHGAGATPQLWAPILQRMDRKTFQPWVFYYPSGLYMDDATEFLRQALSHISLTYPIKKLVIVAHSMGGMIARAAMNLAIQQGRGQEFPLLFVTMSTPWGGHHGAQMAIDYSQIGIIPSWIDLAPESPFQKKLFEIHFPPNIHHYLFFSYKGGQNPFTKGNDDGAVSLASQLYQTAQDSAEKILGFNEDHASILTSQVMITELNSILKSFEKTTVGKQ